MENTRKTPVVDSVDRTRIGIQLLGKEIVKSRKLRGLSQRDLADLIGLPPAQLCKLEKGRHLPHADFLRRIEFALCLPQDALVSMRNQIAFIGFRNDNAAFDDPFHRFVPACDEHTVDEASLRALTEAVSPVADRYAAALEKFGLPNFCRINLGRMKAVTSGDGVEYAEAFRNVVGDLAASLPSLLTQLEQLNFRFVSVPKLPPLVLPDRSTVTRKSFVFHDQRLDNPVIVVSADVAPNEQLYGIAYEIGSYLRYRRKLTLSRTRKTPEWVFCRAFAATLLVPTLSLLGQLDMLRVRPTSWSLALIDNIACRFGVSSMVMVHRLKSLHRIDGGLAERFIARLRRPHACDDPEKFPPRPPLVFGAWLRTLEIAARRGGDER